MSLAIAEAAPPRSIATQSHDADASRRSKPDHVSATAPRTHSPLPALALATLGLVDIVIGYVLGWNDKPNAVPLFYVGFLGLCAPCAWVLVSIGYSRIARLLTGVGLAILLYLAYFLSSPLIASRFDETLHTGTLYALLRTGHLFTPNTMLPISPYYPGLELLAAGVHWLTGLPIIGCEFVVVLASRSVLILVLFLLVERFTGSARAAGIGVLLYCGSTQFFFFNAQFSYQTVAITFALGLIWVVQRALDHPGDRLIQLAVAAVPTVALMLSHHLTSWATVVTLWVWALAHRFNKNDAAFRTVAAHAVLATVLIGAWTALLASRLVNYLGPLFRAAAHQLISIVSGSSKSRQLFTDASGYTTPFWERVVTGASVLVWLVLVMLAGWSALRGRTLGRSRVRWLPVLIAAAYPLLVAARVSPTASDIANRASTFIYFGMSLVIAAWVAPRIGRRPAEILVAGFVVVLLGGTIIGSGPDWSRVPGPFLVSAEQRSVDSVELATVKWASHHLPSGSRIASDTTTNRLLVSMSSLVPVTALGGAENVSPIFYEPTVDGAVLDLIRRNRIDFVIVDTRLAETRPHSASIYEPVGDGPGQLLTRQELAKFATAADFVAIRSGPIVIYDVRGVTGTRRTFGSSTPVGASGPHLWQSAWVAALVLGGLLLHRRRRRPTADRLAAVGLTGLAALMGVGLAGSAVGYNYLVGLSLATILLVVGHWRLRRQPNDPTPVRPLRQTRLAQISLVTIMVGIAVAVWLAIRSEQHALYPHVPTGSAVRSSADDGPSRAVTATQRVVPSVQRPGAVPGDCGTARLRVLGCGGAGTASD